MSDADNSDDGAQVSDQEAAPKAVKRGGQAVALLILLSLCWYLASDRYTPYTSQARVQGYVIGVAPQVSGNVTEVFIANNERVEADQPLFQIDRSQYEIALAKARSDYQNALRQVEAGDAGVEAARANLRSAQANLDKAQKDTNRLERLYKEDPGTISTRRLEISQATLAQSKAAVSAAQAGIKQAIEAKGGDSSEELNTILAIARTGVEKAELDLERTTVRASDRGMITDLRTDVGSFAGAGHPVITLLSLGDVWIDAQFTENNLGHMQAGTPVEILFDSLPGEIFSGVVANIGLGVSAGRTPQPGTLPTVNNDRNWLRPSQRFPVMVRFDPQQSGQLREQLRMGGQASVMAYTEGAWLTRFLGKLYIRFLSVVSYAY
ncbi:HlyD family efflux transporter periplasmic adaptor subunit [Seongchinamella sediminis]|uniref:HlyD family efflux transporter periplasmic adaptor subunit n=1 Tax=Seongchinamella sediminis TaxID=2283635 RepID=A0A3L7DVI3_9GAMM|nr:HlyD family secretion protein [Seongchinamella sediminis]RLQ21577.1 HlyD family efflux transporter periplasmic adaptor subunit [Seongchinamella sediminis]